MAYRRAFGWNLVERSDHNDGLPNFLIKILASDARHGPCHHYCSPHIDVFCWVTESWGDTTFAGLFLDNILMPSGAVEEACITSDSYGWQRVSGGLCITVHARLRIGQMICDG